MSNKKDRPNLLGWLNLGSNVFGNVANVLSTLITNKTNQRIEQSRNAMQLAENEKAYQRSKASHQVALMENAGMSKAGAINAINGGASYQPAAISSAPAQAPQTDLSSAFDGLITIGENAKQRKAQEIMLDKQLAAAEKAQRAQFEENEKARQHDLLLQDIATANQTQHDYLEYEKHKDNYKLNLENARRNWRIVDQQLVNLASQNELLQENIKGAQLDNIRKDLENKNYPQLAKLTNEHLFQQIQRLCLDYNHAVENHNLDKQGKELYLRYQKLTEQYRIDAENAKNELSAYMDIVHLSTNKPAGGVFATLELFLNNFMPAIVKVK